MSDLTWRTSSWSAETWCIEVAATDTTVHVRDSKDTAGPTLAYTPAAWRAFLSGLRAGHFTP